MKNAINSLAPALSKQIQDLASMPLEIIDIDYQAFVKKQKEMLRVPDASEMKDMDNQEFLQRETGGLSKVAQFFEKLRPVPQIGLHNNSANVDTTNKRPESRQILSGRTENRPAVYNNKLSVLALNRIKRDIREIQSDKSIGYLFVGQPDETNLSKCIMRILGPVGSAYEGTLVKIELTFPDDYPMNPPLVRFETPISHPSVDKAGNICLGILNQWTPAGSLKQIGLIISALLDNPSIEEPLTSDYAAPQNGLPNNIVNVDTTNKSSGSQQILSGRTENRPADVKTTKQTRAERLMELLKK